MSSSTTIKSCIDILRRTDPRDTEKNLTGLAKLISNEDIADELYQRVDTPLKVGEDSDADGRKFLLCEHNRDGDSHRSPWSNTYSPPLDDGFRPSERLRSLELHANEVFDIYRELYYGKATSVSSVYLWDKGEEETTNKGNEGKEGFAGCFLIQNRIDDENYWNSIHVIDVGGQQQQQQQQGKCQYKLTTTLLLSITPSSDEYDMLLPPPKSTNISGSLIRHNVRECSVDNNNSESSHIINIGKFIEDMESEMRSEMDSLYIQKTKTAVETIRKECPGEKSQGQEHTKVLNEAVLAMAMNKKANI
ncbi:hypothetical protein ACHAXR_010907 [Thalassiosira sp. AJA248-18]